MNVTYATRSASGAPFATSSTAGETAARPEAGALPSAGDAPPAGAAGPPASPASMARVMQHWAQGGEPPGGPQGAAGARFLGGETGARGGDGWDFGAPWRGLGGELGGGGAAGPTEPEAQIPEGGMPLDPGVRVRMERRFGKDLSTVRVHTDEKSAGAVAAKGARAFTLKNHIFFAPGAFQPGTPAGEALLAHELTHVLQTGGGGGGGQGADGAHEAEANRIATQAHSDAAQPGSGGVPPHLSGAGAPASDAALSARLPAPGAGGAAAEAMGQPAPGYEVKEGADPGRKHPSIGGCTPSQPAAMTQTAPTITVTQAAASLSNRGSAEYKVRWSIGGSKNGWIIQHVKFQGNVTNAAGPVAAKNSGLEYWEAWEVRNGSVYVGFASGGSAHSADTFRTISEDPKTRGNVEIIGKVSFVENYNLQTPPWGYTVAAAGSLPTMTSAPAGWSDGAATDHWMKVQYDDIAGTAQTVTTTP